MAAGLPLFPLGTVLFPGLVLPLRVFEPRYRALVRDLMALPDGVAKEFGVVAIQRGWEVEGDPDGTLRSASVTLYDVGCTAQIRQVTERPDGRYDLVTVGRRRFRLAAVDPETAPYLTAQIEWLDDEAGPSGAADRLAPAVLASFQRYLNLLGASEAERIEADPQDEQLPDEPTALSHLVAATASLSLDDRQSLLAAPTTAARLRAELTVLNREAALLRQIRAVPAMPNDLNSPAPSSN